MSDQQPKQSRLPSIDPGLASIVAAVLTFLGVIITVLVQRDPGPAATPSPAAVVAQTATAEPVPTATDDLPTWTPVPTATDVPPTATPVPLDPTPLPQIVSLLPAAQVDVVRNGAQALLQIGQALPLMVRDDFETRDYGWIESEEIIQGGGECKLALEEGAYRIAIQSAAGAMWCTGGLPRQASDFLLSVDLGLSEERLADVYVLYRMSPDQLSYYSIGINPKTQEFWVNVVDEGQDIPIVPQTFAQHIDPEGTNTVSLVVAGSTHALFFNDQLDVMFTDDRLASGTFGLNLSLQESNAIETLIVDNFEVRGN